MALVLRGFVRRKRSDPQSREERGGGFLRCLAFARTAGQSELVLLIPRVVTDVEQLRSVLELHTALVESAVAAGLVPDFGRAIE